QLHNLLYRPKRFVDLRNLWLFLCLSSFFFISPLADRTSGAWLVINIFMTMSILLTIYAQSELWKWVRILFVMVGLLAAVAGWLPLEQHRFGYLATFLYSIFFGFSFSVYCHKLFTERDVTGDTLFAAGCAYILLGFLFATLFWGIYQHNPDAMLLPDSHGEPLFALTYFSFVTLTTLGYGDIVPATNSTQMLAAYEAIFGQIFVTVVVAELVGTHVAKSSRSSKSDKSQP
ncbi:MAG: ion channel, partial [Planctomycetota bacterium]